jgi:hypothetical protein
MALGAASTVFGVYTAKGAIECDFQKCTHLELTFNDPNLTYINSEKLILITYYNQKYYLTRQVKPAPKNPEIYIISDAQISSIRMKSVENWSDQNQLSFSN